MESSQFKLTGAPQMVLKKTQSMIDGTSTLHDSELLDVELPMIFKHSDTLKPFKTNVQENEKLKAMYKEFYEAYAKNKKTLVETDELAAHGPEEEDSDEIPYPKINFEPSGLTMP